MPQCDIRRYRGNSHESLMHLNSLQTQYILHVVDARILSDDPLGGAESAIGEGVAAAGFVGQLHAFAVSGEDDGVISYHIAAAQGVDANLGAGALAGDALAAVAQRILELQLADA